MASCRVEFRGPAEKDLRRVARRDISRLVSAAQALSENPLPHSVRKLVGGEHTYRIRVGDYRFVYRFLPGDKLVTIERIRHRKDVYRD